MTFSWANAIKNAESLKIRREKTKAKNPTKDYQKEHPDWVREASQGKFTILEKETKEKLKKHVEQAMNRRKRKMINTG